MLVHEKIRDIDFGIQMYHIECFVCDSMSFCDKTAKLYLGMILFSCVPSRVF